MKKNLHRVLNAISWNCITALQNIYINRDYKSVLFGAWMGTKFADNSRYLFQFLSDNKESFGLNHVVWVTRSQDVNKMLNTMGYESYIVGSKESNYWHLKAGYHFVCNAIEDTDRFKSDIDTKRSSGAIKIQLWHGVGGIKSVGAASNQVKFHEKKHKGIIKRLIQSRIYRSLCSPGGWAEAKILSTGKQCSKANIAYAGCRADQVFISGYPRNCECIRYLESELEILQVIRRHKGSVLYLPTFRSDVSDYMHPLEDEKLRTFIENENLIWIEKPHTADQNHCNVSRSLAETVVLPPEFDINTIYRDISCVITDYSSVAFDAIYHKKPLIIYAPDINSFKNGDVGLMDNFETFFHNMICDNTHSLINHLEVLLDDADEYIKERMMEYTLINEYAFDNEVKSYKDIWEDIIALRK